MSVDGITSFLVRCQYVSMDHDSQLKIKVTHIQTNEDLYFDRLEDAFQMMKHVVAENKIEKR
ncbi:MAG: hypothetical protein H0Z32_12780 [Bacillaceae bacterium]|nr:hypothetical protein [Bacillaceae bacterium]